MCLIFIFNELALKANLEKFNYKHALQIFTYTILWNDKHYAKKLRVGFNNKDAELWQYF